jgi:hypothetical protein
MSKLLKWFEGQDHESFSIQYESHIRQDIIAFRNGFYDYHKLQFVSEFTGTTMHYYDMDYDEKLRDVTTPLWDNLLTTQMTEDVKNFLEV